ncbi:MAG: hypothetical protein HQ510_12175 [Candidatus Marinimicrobia bacterium]|nr:hypothetical protein [Candidatus Neomarinimicrobiota bacterium]
MKYISIFVTVLLLSLVGAQDQFWISYADSDSAVIMITTDTETSGFQFSFSSDPILGLQSLYVEPGDVIDGFMLSFNVQSDGSIIYVGFSLVGATIPVGDHQLMTIHYSIQNGGGWLYISSNQSYFLPECIMFEGVIGDVNDDSILDVLDFIVIVNYILGNIEFEQNQICASDRNQDGVIDVTDIISLINYFLYDEPY